MSIAMIVALWMMGDLAAAEAALAARNGDACQSAATDTLGAGQRRPDEVASLWLVRGRCWMMSGDKKRATRAYGIALRVQAALGVDVQAPQPGDDNVLRATRAQLIGKTAKALTIVAESHPRGLQLRAYDDLGAATTMAIMTNDGERLAAVGIDPELDDATKRKLGGAVAQHAFAGVVRSESMVPMAVLLDKHGNWLVAAALRDLVPIGVVDPTIAVAAPAVAVAVAEPAVVAVAPVEAPPPSAAELEADAREAAAIEAEIDRELSPGKDTGGRLAVAGAVAATAGLLTAVTFGALTALAVENGQPATGFIAGVVGGAALFVIGGGCMVMDIILSESALPPKPVPPVEAAAIPPT